MRIPLFNRRGFFAHPPLGVTIVTWMMVPAEEPTAARRLIAVLEYGWWTAHERPARTLTELAPGVGMDPGAGGLVAHYRPGAVN